MCISIFLISSNKLLNLLLNISGVTLKNSLLNLQQPYKIIKVVNFEQLFVNSSCQNPLLASNTVNILTSLNLDNIYSNINKL